MCHSNGSVTSVCVTYGDIMTVISRHFSSWIDEMFTDNDKEVYKKST